MVPNADAQEVLAADHGSGESLELQLTNTTVRPHMLAKESA